MIVPVSIPDNFLALQYSKLRPNQVKVDKKIYISVDRSASPLFYKFNKPLVGKSISVSGQVYIEEKLKKELSDSYFQLGVIYAGEYRPNWITRKILPEWILKVINLNKDFGLGAIDFFHVSGNGTKLNKKDSLRSIKLNFKTIAHLDKRGHFRFSVKLKERKLLGLWLRADGDDHQGKFKTTIDKIELIRE